MEFVQFKDATQTEILSWFASPQDPEIHPNLGEVEDTDERYITFQALTKPAA